MPAVQAKFEQAWGVPLSNRIGLTVTEMLKAAEEGQVKCLYIIGENPMTSDPDLNHVRFSLQKTEFIVSQDIFFTETGQFADVILPAASFVEKEGTFTNTERRIQRVRKAINPPGEAKTDAWIVAELAKRMIALGAVTPSPDAPFAGWDYANRRRYHGRGEPPHAHLCRCHVRPFDRGGAACNGRFPRLTTPAHPFCMWASSAGAWVSSSVRITCPLPKCRMKSTP